jgi:flagellar biosynthetic protein FlhB
MASKDSKTEQPTEKRLDDAKKKGDIARSQDLTSSLSLGASLLFFVLAVPGMGRRLIEFWQNQFGSITRSGWDVNFLTATFQDGLNIYLLLFVPFFILLASIAALTNIVQGGGFSLHLENIRFKGDKFNLIKGIKRIMFSAHSLMELFKSMVKVAVIGYIAYVIVRNDLTEIVLLSTKPLAESLDTMAHLFLKLAGAIILFLFVLAIVDYLWQKAQYTKKMRMTKQEVKDEYKQMEGDPRIKGKRRQIQFQRAMSRMMEKVPQADVVITNPTHYAVAIRYEYKKMKAPVVLAKGKDLIAFKIIERAKENKVPIMENPPLARGIYAAVQIDHPIPEEFFQAVAEILAYLYKLKGRRVS